MSDETIRARFIDAANFLAAVHGEGFTLKDLYAEAKLTQKDFRGVFKNKAELVDAAKQANITAAEIEHSAKSEQPRASDEDWVDRRFRVLERAISSLEIQIADVRADLKNTSFAAPAGEISSSAQAPSHGSEIDSPELPPVILDTDDRVEPPPVVAEFGSASVAAQDAALDIHGDMTAAPVSMPKRTIDREALSSYWSVANDVPERQSYRTILIVVAAIMCGILAGILTSTMHAGADVAASKRAAQSVANNDAQRVATNVTPSAAAKVKPSPIQSLLDQAHKGDPAAETKLAIAYMQGTDVKPDLNNAIQWAQSAASHGNVDAKYLLGALMRAGSTPDLALAAHWYQEAAEGGNVKAMHNFALALLNGSGVQKDDAKAVQWFEQAADLGYRDSQFDLAVLYERGQGVAQNPSEALRWYDKAAASGDTEAAQRATWLRANVREPARKQLARTTRKQLARASR